VTKGRKPAFFCLVPKAEVFPDATILERVINTMKKRIFALLLTLCMVLGLLPMTAWADDPACSCTTKCTEASQSCNVCKNSSNLTADCDPTSTSLSGTGTESDPYQIKSVADLKLVAKNVNDGTNVYSGKYIKLMADLDLSNIASWTPIGTSAHAFMGTFDGGNNDTSAPNQTGYTISNLTINSPELKKVGLFGYIGRGSIVKNVTINNVSITAKSEIGAVVGSVGVASIINCHVKGDIIIYSENASSYKVGGIVGEGYAVITSCTVKGNDGSVIGASYQGKNFEGDNVGGLAGFLAEDTCDVEYCTVENVTVMGTRKVGGLVGSSNDQRIINNCTVKDVTIICNADADYVNEMIVAGNDNEIDIGKMGIGGIVGQFNHGSKDVIGQFKNNTVSDITIRFLNNDEIIRQYINVGIVSGGLRSAGQADANSFYAPLQTKMVTENITVTGNNILPDGIKEFDNPNGGNPEAVVTVAKVGNYEYATLEKAITAAGENGTVTLLQNITLKETLRITQSVTIDLNGYKLSKDNGDRMLLVVNDATLTINGQKTGSEVYGRVTVGEWNNNNGNLVLNGGYYHCCAQDATTDSSIDDPQTVIHVNGTCLNSNVTIKNAKIVSPEGNGIQLSGKGEFLIENSEITGATAIYVKAGTLTVKSGTFTGNKTPADYAYWGNGSHPTGDAIVIDACNYPGGNPTVNIEGGTFTGSKAAVGYYQSTGDDSSKEPGTAAIAITGGTFSSEPTGLYAAPYAVQNNNNTYTVYLPATGVTLDETEETVTYAPGKTIQLTATVAPEGATHSVTWSSDNETVATVDQKGLVTVKKAGSATITATVDGKSATYALTVNKATADLKTTISTTSLEGGGTVTLTVNSTTPASLGTKVTCSDTSITVTDNKDGTYSATLPNATVNYTFTVDVVDDNYQGSQAFTVNVTRYVAATTSSSTSNKTTTTNVGSETGDVANAQVGETDTAVTVTTTTDDEGTVTTTTEKSDGSTTVVEEKTDGTVTTTDTTAEGAVKVVEKTTDGTVTTTDTAVNGVEAVTVEVPGEQVKATVTIPETVESAVVTIPVSGELTAGMVAMDADTGEIIMLSALTEDGLTLKLDGSANIVIVDNSKDFDDVPDDNWASNGVAYATAHNLFNGKSEETFDPDGDMTRTMLMTVLARFEGLDTTAGSTWDEVGMNWAVERGITDGSNPDGSITREQLATMLYRYAGSPAVTGEVTGFSDAENISSYAADAMAWAVQVGILTGNTRGELNPTATATRGQVATMMMRFGQAQVK
jgi:hypothetical protein